MGESGDNGDGELDNVERALRRLLEGEPGQPLGRPVPSGGAGVADKPSPATEEDAEQRSTD